MLGHLVVVDYCSDGECNLVLAAQWSLLSPRPGLNFEQRLLGGIEQVEPLARSLLGKQRIAADDQALAGIRGRRDIGEVVLIEQGELDDARRDAPRGSRHPQQRADRDVARARARHSPSSAAARPPAAADAADGEPRREAGPRSWRSSAPRGVPAGAPPGRGYDRD